MNVVGEDATVTRRQAVAQIPGNSQRFTRDGDEALEQHLARTCDEVGTAVRALVPEARLQGVLLGGGYGRGEGGVLRGPDGDMPYNDLEFYVFVTDKTWLTEAALGGKLQEAAEGLSPAAGVEVEFKLTNLKRFRSSPTSMFSYDLIWGHRWVIGHEGLFAGCEQHRDASRIPLSEGARLLMNRCSGLLFSAEYLDRRNFGPAEADFVGRNLAKAQLGFGDTWLAAHGQYHWSCLERHERLKRLRIMGEPAWVNALRAHHAAGVEFKLHPVRSTESRENLLVRHAELSTLARQLWMWLESRRLGARFESVWQYATSRVNKCPETRGFKNRLINVRTFGPTALMRPSASRYPRERLFHSLCLMLFEPAALEQGRGLRVVQDALQTTAASFPELVHTYRRLWNRYN